MYFDVNFFLAIRNFIISYVSIIKPGPDLGRPEPPIGEVGQLFWGSPFTLNNLMFN